jgi:hypothetical protein
LLVGQRLLPLAAAAGGRPNNLYSVQLHHSSGASIYSLFYFVLCMHCFIIILLMLAVGDNIFSSFFIALGHAI